MFVIDAWLLGLAQRFCNWFQLMTGLTKFWLERFCIGVTGILLCLVAQPRDLLFVACFAVTLFGWSFRRIGEEETAFFEQARLRSPVGPLYRLVGLLIGIVGVVWVAVWYELSILLLAIVGLFIASTYISECIPRPPGRCGIEEWRPKTFQTEPVPK